MWRTGANLKLSKQKMVCYEFSALILLWVLQHAFSKYHSNQAIQYYPWSPHVADAQHEAMKEFRLELIPHLNWRWHWRTTSACELSMEPAKDFVGIAPQFKLLLLSNFALPIPLLVCPWEYFLIYFLYSNLCLHIFPRDQIQGRTSAVPIYKTRRLPGCFAVSTFYSLPVCGLWDSLAILAAVGKHQETNMTDV